MGRAGNEPKNKRRRSPRQARSRVTVDAIFEATVQLLKSDGHGGLTARLIAERAGVSVGSLYQYFPSKEAVIVALADAQREAALDAVRTVLRASEGQSLETRISGLLEEFVLAKTKDPDLQIPLAVAMLEIHGSRFLFDDTEPFREVIVELLSAHRSEADFDDVDMTSFVLICALEGLLVGAVTQRLRLDDPQLFAHLRNMAMGVLRVRDAAGDSA